MTETDLSDWLVTMEAAMRIGCSTRTIERLGKARQLESRLRPQAGSPPVAVYNPDDVARIAVERRPAPPPFVLRVGPASAGPNGQGTRLARPNNHHHHPTASPAAEDLIRQFFALAIQALQSSPSPPVAATVAETLYVTVKDAAAILGLPQADVRRLCHDGDLNHRLTGRGGIRIRRKDLEAL